MRRITRNKAKSNAKLLRRRMTKPEVYLWTVFYSWREHGVNIRRQHPIGSYIVDFAHLSSKSVIEVDGKSHDESQIDYDQQRQKFLESQGFNVIRVSNDDALLHTDSVTKHIWNTIHRL